MCVCVRACVRACLCVSACVCTLLSVFVGCKLYTKRGRECNRSHKECVVRVYIQYVYTYDGISVAAGGVRINSRLCVFSRVSTAL